MSKIQGMFEFSLSAGSLLKFIQMFSTSMLVDVYKVKLLLCQIM